jgi:acetyl esterase/lipase
MTGITQGVVDEPGARFRTVPPTSVVPLHPAIRAMLDAEIPGSPFEAVPVPELRALREEMMLRRPRRNEPVALVQDRTLPGPAGEIPVRVYRPSVVPGPHPIVAYFHGGGWVLGTLETHDDVCRTLASRSGALVVSVGYRRAPEHRFPVPLEDCVAAVHWCAMHGSDIGGDGARLAVAGDSAGGNLAAAAALRFRDEGGPALALQVLIYPVTNCGFDTASYHQFATGFGLTRDTMRYFWKSYLLDSTDGGHPYASPLQVTSLAGVSPALILTAQYDVLRDEGEAYAARLAQAGVAVRCTRYLEMNHGFIQFAALCEPALQGLEEIAGALRTAFAG